MYKKIYPIAYYPSVTDTVISANTFDDLLSGNFKNSLQFEIKPYKGMIVCVNNESKIYLLNEEDITKPQNWMHIGNFNLIKKQKENMKNIITKKATEMYPAGTQNALQFRTGFVEGAKWMKKEMLEEVWNIIFENITDISEDLMWEQTNSIEVADKIKKSLEDLF